MDTEIKQVGISRGDSETYFPSFESLYSFSIFVSEHLRLLYRPINEGRVETQVSLGKG